MELISGLDYWLQEYLTILLLNLKSSNRKSVNYTTLKTMPNVNFPAKNLNIECNLQEYL